MIFLISLMSSIGLAILLVEKGDDWPVSFFKGIISDFLEHIHGKMPEMLSCSVCTSFWAALIVDGLVFLYGASYFLWPISGFAAAGATWVLYQFLNSIDNIAVSNMMQNGDIEDE